MYFPYLRCKQFELLALRELCKDLGQSQKISPILEPVKRSVSTLERAMDALIAYNVNFTIIINPIVGDFSDNSGGIVTLINSKLQEYNNFQIGVIVNQFTNLDRIDR